MSNENIDDIRYTYKQLVIADMRQKNYDEAIKNLNLWQYCYLDHLHADTYKYDFEIFTIIDKYLSDVKFKPILVKPNKKVCIVYLIQGILSSSSIMTKIIIDLIKKHDKSKFEIHVFIIEDWLELHKHSGKIFIQQFKDIGCPIHYAPLFKFGFSRLYSIAKKINSLNPHILITTAALADFNHYFITALKPAPITIGFVMGCPAQFVSPSFDYGITWINRIRFNCPIPCLNPGMIYAPESIKQYKKVTKSDYGIPEDSIVIISAGRYPKFQDDRVLNLVIESMETIPNLHYVIIGPTCEQIPRLNTIESTDIKQRIHVFEWSQSYEDYLSISDIYLDTFPSGGGITLFDAALLYMPIVSFTDEQCFEFDQSNWNPAQELFSKESIILIDRNNLSDITSVISQLCKDEQYRYHMGRQANKGYSELRERTGDCVRNIENFYINAVSGKVGLQ